MAVVVGGVERTVVLPNGVVALGLAVVLVAPEALSSGGLPVLPHAANIMDALTRATATRRARFMPSPGADGVGAEIAYGAYRRGPRRS
jgi:hypothetical protein